MVSANKRLAPNRAPRVLFFVEGFTDIRFVLGLNEICGLTLTVPARQFHESGLDARLEQAGANFPVHRIPGGRFAFQILSLLWLFRHARLFDVILAQDCARGALNANLVGKLLGIPVLNYLGIAPLEYFRCRRERRQIGALGAAIGTTVLWSLLTVNGWLARRCLAMGPYLVDVARRYYRDVRLGLYYGVDTTLFRPASQDERRALRLRHDLPEEKFLVLLSSRISHEKDPETVLRACAAARERGLDLVLLNLGGGYQRFLQLAGDLGLPDAEHWVLGRPAAHPMGDLADYFRCADALALGSLAEGAAFSTLEALACGTPVVATAVGGMAVQLAGLARLVPRQDVVAMADALCWIAQHPQESRTLAARGRDYVSRHWQRDLGFRELRRQFDEVLTAKHGESAALGLSN